MELLDYLNAHDNWEELLAGSPYFLQISKQGRYALLMYTGYASDMALPLVQEARGPIFYEEDDKTWSCVCYPFNKFFNSIEPYAATSLIDWSSALVQQKVDGSLIKFWFHNNEWHVSTNKTIDAFSSILSSRGVTFGEMVERATEVELNEFCKQLDPTFTYMFELTAPENRLVVKYEGTHLWYLGQRSIRTFKESYDGSLKHVLYPRLYTYGSLDQCLVEAARLGENDEGFVVVDKNWNRIKIKGATYLALAKLHNNGQISTRSVIEMWKDNTLDDYMALEPENQKFCQSIMSALIKLMYEASNIYEEISYIESDKDFATAAQKYNKNVQPCLFALRRGRAENAMEYYRSLSVPSLVKAVENEKEA